VRATPAIEATLSGPRAAVAGQEAAVLAARSELAKASRQMVRMGAVVAASISLSSAEARSVGSVSVKGA
jgi:hypothetical protein